MNLYEKIDINENIVSYLIKAKYNETLTTAEEIEIETLHDYVYKIKFSEIDFKANVKMDNGMPTVTQDNVSTDVVEVSLGKVNPKEYVLDENFEIEFSVDAGRIPDSEVNSVLDTKSLVSQAKIAVFQSKIKEKITEIIEKIRKEDNNFEIETETIV